MYFGLNAPGDAPCDLRQDALQQRFERRRELGQHLAERPPEVREAIAASRIYDYVEIMP